MRWTPGGDSSNIEDRRGQGGGFGRIGGIGGGIVTLILALIFGPGILQQGGGDPAGTTTQESPGSVAVQETPAEHDRAEFTKFVVNDVEGTWEKLLGQRWEPSKVVLYRDMTQSGCGMAQSATGPFYCPVDHKVYLDLGFFDDLSQRFGASGDFAQAYVIAHELGHHVQNLTGVAGRVHELEQAHPNEANALSVRLELQADCYAGVWGRTTDQRGILEKGDVEEGLNAASSVGDDRLQKAARGYVQPESFTHGSAAQRSQWFRKGFESGDPRSCDTFGGSAGF